MKKVLFFVLLLMVLGAASVNAQVTIGEDSEPHPGAVLDLKTSKGLLLPRVTLASVNIFQLSEEYADVADGMMVYNNYDATIGGQGKGIYVWDGSKWMFAGISGPVQTPVTSVVVRSQGDITDVMSGSTLMFYADVEPANATNRNVIWSVVPGGSGSGLIDPVSGLFNANSPGTVTVRATALDGSNQYNTKQLTVLPATIPVTGITISPQNPPTLYVPAEYQLSATITPGDASDKSVVWDISAPVGAQGVTVNGAGKVNISAPGTYTIRARAGSNLSFHDEVTVVALAPPMTQSCEGCATFAKQSTAYPEYVYWGLQGGYCHFWRAADWLANTRVRYRWDGETWRLDRKPYGPYEAGNGLECSGER